MIELTIEAEVICTKCEGRLVAATMTKNGREYIVVEPCKACLDDAIEKAMTTTADFPTPTIIDDEPHDPRGEWDAPGMQD